MPGRDALRRFLNAPPEGGGQPGVDTAQEPTRRGQPGATPQAPKRREALRAFLNAPAEGPTTDPRSLLEPVTELTPAQSAVYSASDVVPFVDQIGAAAVAAGETALSPFRDDDRGIGERYRDARGEIARRQALGAEQNPIASGAGTLAGVGAQVVTGAGGPRAAYQGAKGAVQGVRGLLSREGLLSTRGAIDAGRNAVGAILSREGGKAALAGGAYGAAYDVSEGESDLTRGEFADALLEGLEGFGKGAAFTAGATGAFGAGLKAAEARLASKAAGAGERAATARAVEEYDAARAALPERRAEARARNQAATERFRQEKAAAKTEAASATRAAQDAEDARALAASREPTRDRALLLSGLEGRASQNRLGGPSRAKQRAEELFDEPLPGDPSRTVLDRARELGPDERLAFAGELRQGAGAELGAVREELAAVPTAFRQARVLKRQVREAFGDLPREVQQVALRQVDNIIDRVSGRRGRVTPQGLRKAIQDVEDVIRYDSANLEAQLGKPPSVVLQSARRALVEAEKSLIAQYLPERAPAYLDALRRYGLFSDFERGAREIALRANAGQAPIRYPKPQARKLEPVEPRKVQRPVKEEVRAPEFEGGDEALAEARRVFAPRARRGGTLLRATGEAIGSSLGYGVGGVPGAILGQRSGRAVGRRLVERWLAEVKPTAASLGADAEKATAQLERFAPVFEDALAQGPQAVLVAHKILLDSQPEYRQALTRSAADEGDAEDDLGRDLGREREDDLGGELEPEAERLLDFAENDGPEGLRAIGSILLQRYPDQREAILAAVRRREAGLGSGAYAP